MTIANLPCCIRQKREKLKKKRQKKTIVLRKQKAVVESATTVPFWQQSYGGKDLWKQQVELGEMK